MSDLVERLRINQFVHSLPNSVFTDMHDAANEIDRLRVVERVYRRILSEGGVTSGVYEELYRLRAENEALRAKTDRTVKILTEIHLMLCPPKTYADGKTHVFRPPNVAEYWQELSERIRAIPDALDAAMREQK